MKAVWPKGWENKPGHYAPGMISGGMLYISGQLPVDHRTGKMAKGGAAAHAEAALRSVEQVLLAAGLGRDSVVQCRVYIPDVALWDEVDAVYAEFFKGHKPARVIVPSRGLHHGALVEIEAVAEMEGAK